MFERDLAHVEKQTEQLRGLQSLLEPGEPLAAQIDLGLRINAVLAEWLAEQLEQPSRGRDHDGRGPAR